MRAGLQRHVHRRPGRILAPPATILQRRPLGVQPPQLGMKPLADHLPAPHNDGSNQRIRADPPETAVGKLQRPPQMSTIRVCELGVHLTD